MRDIKDFVSETPTATVLSIVGVYCIKSIVWFIPVYALYIGAGMLLPTGPAIAVTYLGLVVDLTLTFYYGRYVGKSRIMDEIKRRKAGKWLLETAERNIGFAAFILRILPGAPVELTNMLFGALDMKYFKFLILSLLGMTPSILPVIFMGKAVMNPRSKEFILPLLVSIFIAVSSIAIYWIALKRRNNSNTQS